MFSSQLRSGHSSRLLFSKARVSFNHKPFPRIGLKQNLLFEKQVGRFRSSTLFNSTAHTKRAFHYNSVNHAPWFIPASVVIVTQQVSRLVFFATPFFYRYNFFTKYPLFSKYFIRTSLLLFVSSIVIGLEYSEYGNRWRFSVADDKSFIEISKFQLQQLLNALPLNEQAISKAQFQNTKDIFMKLLRASGETKNYMLDKEWDLYINEQDQFNALVFISGTIIVNKGTYDFIESQDELAFIVAHELSHLLFSHSAEFQTTSSIGDAIILFLNSSVLAVSFIFPVFYELLSPLILNGVSGMFLMPHSRAHELEADKAALFLMARAGFDPRKAPGLWRRLVSKDLTDNLDNPETKVEVTKSSKKCFSELHFLQTIQEFGGQTHPESLERATVLERMIPQVLPIYFETLEAIDKVKKETGFGVGLSEWFGFSSSSPTMRFIESHEWQPLYKEKNWNAVPIQS